jgi:hypothetical protein
MATLKNHLTEAALAIVVLGSCCLILGCATLKDAFCPGIGMFGVDCGEVEDAE